MSRLWPERLSVTLAPRPDEVGNAEPWRGALEDFRARIAGLRRRVDVSVVLSNHFVRYAVLPGEDDAASPEEELALARFHFAKIHGERAKGWEVRVSEQLACAIDGALIDALKSCFAKAKARLVSVQPYLMAAYNRSRGRIPSEGAWLLLTEHERSCLARLAPRGWASVYNARETQGDELLERERSRASGESLPSLVLREQL